MPRHATPPSPSHHGSCRVLQTTRTPSPPAYQIHATPRHIAQRAAVEQELNACIAAKGLAEATVGELMARVDALAQRVSSAPTALAASVTAAAKERDGAMAQEARLARELEAALSK